MGHRQAPADALDEVLAEVLESERQDYREAVEGIREGYADFKAGRTERAEERRKQATAGFSGSRNCVSFLGDAR